jgi:drug/metabolite transporter (DMT)-like permease
MAYAGESAAVATAVCWAFNSICFTLAGRKVGSPTVNGARLVLALAMLVPLHLVLFGTAYPIHAGRGPLLWLSLSGLIGFALGDAFLFEAFLCLGARVAMLLMTLAPIFSVLLARVFLGQTLGWGKGLAILATLAGIAWVVADTPAEEGDAPPRRWALGIVLGTAGALGQALGLVLSNLGMKGGLNPWSANLIRVTAGTAAVLLWFLMRGQLMDYTARLKDRTSTLWIAAGAVTGPVIGVALSLFSITHAPMGVAATLMSLSPILLLPAGVWIFRERVTPWAWAGTALSLAGAAALFLT